MFSLTPNPTFKALVRLSVPGEETRQPVVFEFRHKNKAQLSKWISEAKGRSDADVLAEVIVGWEMLDRGEPVYYSRDRLNFLVGNHPVAHAEIVEAYIEELAVSKKKI